MPEFAEFTPIINKSKEEILAYYKENNIPIDDNPYFLHYLESNTSDPQIAEPLVNRDSSNLTTISTTSTSNEKDTGNIWGKYYVKKQTPIVKIPERISEKDLNEIQQEIYSLNIPEEDKIYLDVLAKGESSYDPYITNTKGYFGLYQFGPIAFREVGKTKEDFKDTKIQHSAALELANKNLKYLKNYLIKFNAPEKDPYSLIGKTINGIKLTLNGIKAAMHHQGALTFFDWLYGTKYSPIAKNNFKDAYGSHITRYLKRFQ